MRVHGLRSSPATALSTCSAHRRVVRDGQRDARQRQCRTAGVGVDGVRLGQCAHFANDPESARLAVDRAYPCQPFGYHGAHCDITRSPGCGYFHGRAPYPCGHDFGPPTGIVR